MRIAMRRHRYYSVRSVGLASGTESPPMDFLRFRTRAQAQSWIDACRPGIMTRWQIVDLRDPDGAYEPDRSPQEA